jgi:hypothetical protein
MRPITALVVFVLLGLMFVAGYTFCGLWSCV